MAGTSPAMTITMDTARALQRAGAKGVAGLHITWLIAGHEPLFALRSGAVSEAVGHHPARRLALQRVVADRGRRGQRGIDVAGLEEARPLLLLAVDPDAGETIGLQLDLDL